MMSNDFWNKLNVLVGYFTIATLCGLLVLTSHIEIKDLDLWLHLKTGQMILEQGRVFAYDIFSCMLHAREWANHEWLFQVLVASLHALGGFDAIISMQVVVVTLTFLVLLLFFYRQERQLLIVFGLLLVILIYQSRLTIRPDIFSILFLSVFLSIVIKAHHKRGAFLALAIAQLFWVNMHGFFIFGPILVWLSVLGIFINNFISKMSFNVKSGRMFEPLEYGFLLHASWVLPLICLINPLGFNGAIYPISVALHINHDAGIFFKHIVELARPITADTIFTFDNAYYKAMIFCSFYSFIINRRHVDLRVLFIWIVFLIFSLVAVRNMIFFGVVGFWALMINSHTYTLESFSPIRFINIRFKHISAIIIKILLIGWMINVGAETANNGYFDFDTYERKSEFEGISKRNFPTHAVDFLVDNQVTGNFFNDFNSGAYLIGRAHPHIKVFIDGRTELYGSKFFEKYQDIWKKGDVALFKQYAKEYNITGAFLNSFSQDIPKKCVRMFYHLKDWHVVYFNDDALILLKDTPKNAALIKKFKIDLSQWKTKQMDLPRLGTKRLAPFPFINRATTLYSLGFYQQALIEAKAAQQVSVDYAPAYRLIGKIYFEQKDYKQAFHYLRSAVMLYPYDVPTRYLFLQSYEGRKLYQEAIVQYQRILENNPNDIKALTGIIRCNINVGHFEKAFTLFEKIDIKNVSAMDIIKIGDELSRNKQYQLALRIYQKAFVKKESLDTLNYHIGLTYLKTGDRISARKYLEAGLVINSNHKGIKNILRKNLKSNTSKQKK